MASLLKNILPFAWLALAAAACGDEGLAAVPTAPSLTTAPTVAPTPVSTNAIPIALGETVARVVADLDPVIETTWGHEPAQRFSVVAPRAGVLNVRVTSPGPTGLTVWVNTTPRWGTVHEVVSAARVQGGRTYEIAVSMHDVHSTTQAFELTTSLDPQ
jgi:hypothetical protein